MFVVFVLKAEGRGEWGGGGGGGGGGGESVIADFNAQIVFLTVNTSGETVGNTEVKCSLIIYQHLHVVKIIIVVNVIIFFCIIIMRRRRHHHHHHGPQSQ